MRGRRVREGIQRPQNKLQKVNLLNVQNTLIPVSNAAI